MKRFVAVIFVVVSALSVGTVLAFAAEPLCEEEREALKFLDFVTAPMSAADEARWWNSGGKQYGIFSARYSIAFAGYAAGALGVRGNAEECAKVGRVLDNCISRILRRENWAYSQSKNYWGDKPWAPDPCYRENVMYTGHLLHLMALYETFTNDRKYWTNGFDFVWTDGRVVHYDVSKLIDVTVQQMRANSHHGVTCEPGLLFFPCNNHPHIAFRLFERLGHGNWSEDSRRWEEWALNHFLNPSFGGGAVNLVYMTRAHMFYPRGSSGLDGWSVMWYAPWAEKHSSAVTLWRKVAEKIDWDDYKDMKDSLASEGGCCDPQPVPPTVSAAFLAAAARACDDSATAERMEKALDRFLVRRDGMYYLDLDRRWLIGATAHRIIALAEKHGSVVRYSNITP